MTHETSRLFRFSKWIWLHGLTPFPEWQWTFVSGLFTRLVQHFHCYVILWLSFFCDLNLKLESLLSSWWNYHSAHWRGPWILCEGSNLDIGYNGHRNMSLLTLFLYKGKCVVSGEMCLISLLICVIMCDFAVHFAFHFRWFKSMKEP